MILKTCDKYDLSQIQTGDLMCVANNTEALNAIEEIVKMWMKQIEVVLAESEQIRSETDNIRVLEEPDQQV